MNFNELTKLDILDKGVWSITNITSSNNELNRICNWLIKKNIKIILNNEKEQD